MNLNKYIYKCEAKTLQELLNHLWGKTNELVDCYNELPNEVEEIIRKIAKDGTLTELIDEDVLNGLNAKVNSIKRPITDYRKYVIDNNWTQALNIALQENHRIYFPKGEYKLDKIENIPSNRIIEGDGEETIIIPTKSTLFYMRGTAGEQKEINNDIVDFSNIINLKEENLFEIGDIVLIRGQRDCLTYNDCGDNWTLGYATPGSQGCCFGEFSSVENVEGTTITTEESRIYPNYLSHKTFETSPMARDCTTVEKINPIQNVQFKNFKIKGWAKYIFDTQYIYNCTFENIIWEHEKYKQSDNGIKFIMLRYGWKCLLKGCDYKKIGGDEPLEHHYINVFTLAGCQDCIIDGCKANGGTQPIDISYLAEQICSSNNIIQNCEIHNASQTGICSHGGTYKTMFLNNKVFSCKQGICNRSKNALISNNVLSGLYSAQHLQYGIALYEGHATDCIISNNSISNFGSGITIVDGADLGETFLTCNALITNNTINNCFYGIITRRGSNANRETILNIMIKDNVIKMDSGKQGMYLYENTSGVTIEGNIIQFAKKETESGHANSGVWMGYNCMAIRIYTNVFRNSCNGMYYRGITDTTLERVEIKHKDNIYSYIDNKTAGATSSKIYWDEVDHEKYLKMEPIYSTGDYTTLETIPNNTLFVNNQGRLCFKDINGNINPLYTPEVD